MLVVCLLENYPTLEVARLRFVSKSFVNKYTWYVSYTSSDIGKTLQAYGSILTCQLNIYYVMIQSHGKVHRHSKFFDRKCACIHVFLIR